LPLLLGLLASAGAEPVLLELGCADALAELELDGVEALPACPLVAAPVDALGWAGGEELSALAPAWGAA
jgi:hypothetical protein